MDNKALASVLDELPEHIAFLDENAVICRVNRAWRSFSATNGGNSDRTEVGVNYLEACSRAAATDADVQQFCEGIRSVLNGKRERVELEYPCHSPRESRWFIARAARLEPPAQARAVVIHQNITARRKLSDSMRDFEQRLRDAIQLERLSLWAGFLTHEVLNPLSGAILRIELIQRMLGPATKEPLNLSRTMTVRDACTAIGRQLKSAAETLSRQRESIRYRVDEPLQEVSVKELLEDLAAIMGYHTELSGTRLLVDANEGLHLVGHRFQLSRVLMHLLLDVAAEPDTALRLTASEQDSRIKFQIHVSPHLGRSKVAHSFEELELDSRSAHHVAALEGAEIRISGDKGEMVLLVPKRPGSYGKSQAA